MIELKNGNYIFFEGEWMRINYSHVEDTPCWHIYTKNQNFIEKGFEKQGNSHVLKLPYGTKYDYPAYTVETFCKYNSGIYYFENIWDNLAILSPELETKKRLGMHIYDDSRIELDYDKFIDEVSDIWEERKPIDGFKFDVEPIHYIKRDNPLVGTVL